MTTSTITITKQKTKLTVAKKIFKIKSTKKITATLKSDNNKVIANKKIILKVNGKKYVSKTNIKGIATFNIKLNKKGTFKIIASFAGDAYYTTKTTNSKIIIK